MFQLNTDTKAIVLPQGDTLAFKVTLKRNGETANLPEATVGVFGICSGSSKPKPVFSKAFPVIDDTILVYLTNADTRNIKVSAKYSWDIRIVIDPAFDSSGNIICDDDSDNVFSIFAGAGDLPEFEITGVAANV